MKIRTLDQLSERMDDDIAWRKQELAVFNATIPRKSGHVQTALLRSSVALLYAHWEGHIKNVIYYYLCFLASKGLKTEDLRPEIAALTMRGQIQAATEARKIAVHIEVVRCLREESSSNARIPNRLEDVQTNSNLSFEVLDDLLLGIGCDSARYKRFRDLINEQLVSSRNKVAHGENSAIALPEWKELHADIVSILDDIRTQVMNAAATEDYRSSARM